MIYNNRYFKSMSSGEIFTETQLRAFKSIMGATPEDLIKENLIEEMKEAPDVADILKINGRNNTTPAIQRYRELHKVNGKEAVEAVRKMLSGMSFEKNRIKAVVMTNEG